ncbi:MAG TPA: hypothetical protein VKE40_04780 [Gemmataceae bacterium]|nr:hypothetical protein [Gemmataceae bacterium]
MPAVAPAEAKTRSDLDQLQGVWTSVAGPCEARFLIAGSRFSFEFVGGDIYIGTFKLAPGEMDMLIEEGPADHKGQVAPCIYHVEGGVLRWCPGRIGSGRRLSAFPSVDDRRYLCLVFRRAPRARARA